MAPGYRYFDGPDRAYYKVDFRRLNSLDRTVTFAEGGGFISFEMPAEKYWMHRDAALDGAHPSFWLAFETELNAVAANTYKVVASTPTGGGLAQSGITIQRTAGAADASIDWSNTGIDPRLLGFAHDVTGTSPLVFGIIVSPLSMFGKFQSPWKASYKRPDDRRTVLRSAQSAHGATVDFGPEPARFWRYKALWAAHVYRYAAEESALAGNAGLAVGDTHNALAHLWWEGASDDIILVHGWGDQDLMVSPATAGDARQYEVVQLDPDYQGLRDLRGALREWEGPERYDVDLRLYITGGEFRH